MPRAKASFLRARRRGGAALLAAVLAASAVVAAPEPPPAAAADPILPFGFTDEVVISGLSFPTKVEFAPNGQIFVAEQSGRIKMFESLDDPSPTLVADLRPQVYHYWDKGLLGLAVDPDYPARPYVYALYSYDAEIGGTHPKWNDACGEMAIDGCVSSARLSRLTLDANTVMTNEKVLVHDWCGQYPSHSIGTVTFGKDGLLYAGAGDGASFNINEMDHGQNGGTVIDPATGEPYVPVNPCGDPPGGVGVALSPPDAQGGSLRSQSPRRPAGQATVLNGSIIRIDPDTGEAVPGNPGFDSGRDDNERRIVAFGLRNPYRFTFRPDTNELWIGDVGSWRFEEINRIADPTDKVVNHGWPCYEGPQRLSAWDELNVDSCEQLYAAGAQAVAEPYFAYRLQNEVFAGDGCSINTGVVSGLAFEEGGFYPTRYRSTLFFADYSRRCIWAMRAGADGLPDPGRLEVFVQDAAGPVDLTIGPDGQLYYVDIGGGKIHRVTYNGENQPPVIVVTADPLGGPAPLEVHFDASGSYDPEEDPLSFAWDLDGDGEFDDASGPTVTHTYAFGFYVASLRLSDDHGNAVSQDFEIDSGNLRPVPVIESPSEGTTWHVGKELVFSGHATDDRDGTVAPDGLTWTWIMHHCTGPAPAECHEHTVYQETGIPDAPFVAPDHEHPSYLELRLTATDSQGLTATASRTFEPESVDVTFASDPTGLQLSSAGELTAAPYTRTFIVGSQIGLNAPESQWYDGTTYTFANWSDGGERLHSINAPATDQTYTATYTAVPTTDAPNTCAGATTVSDQDTWLSDTISRKRDVDWYRFNITGRRHIRIVLGNLGGNYRLDLFKKCGARKAVSIRPGQEFEEIYRRVNSGTFRVRVKRQAGPVAKTVPYGLKLSQLDEGVQLLNSTGWTDTAGDLNVAGEVLNNTDERRRLIRVTATLFDSPGNVLATADHFAWVNIVPGRTRSQFRMTVPRPPGYHHYTAVVDYSQVTSEEVFGGLRITSSGHLVDSKGVRFSGSLINENSAVAHWTSATTVLYDKWGDVLHVDSRLTNPYQLSPGATATYEVPFTAHYAGWNRATTLIQGSF